MPLITLELKIQQPTEADWQAVKQEIEALFNKYGDPDAWQPHTEAIAQAEYDRIIDNISQCFDYGLVS